MKVEIITIHYNTPHLLISLLTSLDKYETNIPIRVIDGSDKDLDTTRKLCDIYKNVTLEELGWNIHHGAGMNYGVLSSKADYCLLIDTDMVLIESVIDKMLSKNKMIVGKKILVNDLGFNDENGFPYYHPQLMLINVNFYKELYSKDITFIHHGAPCLEIMKYLQDNNLDICENFSYFNLSSRGTVNLFGYNLDKNMKTYEPKFIGNPIIVNTVSAWGNIPYILESIIKDFNLQTNRALEFGVERGYSTSSLANYFNSVKGVDVFADVPTFKYEEVKENLKEYKNITLYQQSFQEWILKDNEYYDLIHIDIIHNYDDTFTCGDWACKHSKCVIFHDTISFKQVMRAVEDLSRKHNMEFYNYPLSKGLGILVKR